MKRKSFLVVLGLLVFLAAASSASVAQVKQIEMHIDGYLCGN